MVYDARAIAAITGRPTAAGIEVLSGSNVILNVAGPGVGRFAIGNVLQLFPPETRRGGEIAQAFNTIDFLISGVSGGQLTGTLNPNAVANPPQVEKGWLADGRAGLTSTAIITTRAGIQAAWDALPATGGVLELPVNTTIVSDGTLIEWSGKDDVTVRWPSTFVLKAPTNSSAYKLLQIGDTPGAATLTLNDVSAVIKQDFLHFASVASYTAGQMLLMSNASLLMMNRVSYVDVAALRVYFDYPLAFPMTAGASVGVYTLPNLTKRFRLEGRMTIDVGGNTHLGLKSTATFSNATTITAPVLQDATVAAFASVAGYAAGDYILIGGNVLKQIPAGGITGLNVTVDLPFAPTAAGTSVQKVVGGLNDMQPSYGAFLSILENPFIEDFWVTGIVGSGVAANYLYQPLISGRVFDCGFAYNPTTDPWAGAFQVINDTGAEYHVKSVNAKAWGIWGDMQMYMTGASVLEGIGSVARNVKQSTLRFPNGPLFIGIGGRYKTGVAISNASIGGKVRAFAEGNGGNGVWLDNTGNTDMVIEAYASGNNRLAAEQGDVFVETGATNTRVFVENVDAVVVDQSHATEWLDSVFIPAAASGTILAADGTPVSAGLTGDSANNFNRYMAWAFDGTAIEDVILAEYILPADWSAGIVTPIVHWAGVDATAGNVLWRLLPTSVGAADQEDEVQEVTLDGVGAAPAVRDKEVRTTLATWTPTGRKLRMGIARVPTDALDTLNGVDAWYVGLELQFYRKRVPTT